MLVLKREQLELLSDTLKDIANIAAGAMIFGQVLSDRSFSMWIALGGLGLWMALVTFAITLAGKRQP